MNPEKAGDYKRLREAITHSNTQIDVYRRHRNYAIKQSVGTHYAEKGDGAPDNVVLPLVPFTVKLYLRHLVGQCPQALTSTQIQERKGSALRLELALNQVLTRINFGKTMRTVARDAMYAAGFLKIALGYTQTLEIDGAPENIGEPYAQAIDLDDMFWDIRAKTSEQWGFVGNDYYLPKSFVEESPLFKKTGELPPSDTPGLDERGQERIEHLTRPRGTDDHGYEQQVAMRDIFLPREKLMVTGLKNSEQMPLRIREFSGPTPYRMLSYGDVPNQVNPLPPVALWIDLHDFANRMYRKLISQAERQKEVTAYSSAAAADAQRVQETSDGELFRADHPGQINPIKMGGADPRLMALSIHTRDLFSWFAGNLESIGGLGPQSETLGQDQLLAASSSKTLQDLQQRTLDFTDKALEALGWYLWHDPLIMLPLTKRIRGADIEVPMTFSPETREGDLGDYDIKLNPHSVAFRSAGEKLTAIRRLWREDVMPLLPLLEAQGLTVDIQAYLRIVSRYGDLAEVEDLVRFVTPNPEQMAAGGDRGRQSPVTRRENVRINRPGGTRMGADKSMIQTLLGGGVQESEGAAAASVGR